MRTPFPVSKEEWIIGRSSKLILTILHTNIHPLPALGECLWMALPAKKTLSRNEMLFPTRCPI